MFLIYISYVHAMQLIKYVVRCIWKIDYESYDRKLSTTELICNDPKRRANEAESSENWQTTPELVEIFRYTSLRECSIKNDSAWMYLCIIRELRNSENINVLVKHKE